jgi:hypothetical protein
MNHPSNPPHPHPHPRVFKFEARQEKELSVFIRVYPWLKLILQNHDKPRGDFLATWI